MCTYIQRQGSQHRVCVCVPGWLCACLLCACVPGLTGACGLGASLCEDWSSPVIKARCTATRVHHGTGAAAGAIQSAPQPFRQHDGRERPLCTRLHLEPSPMLLIPCISFDITTLAGSAFNCCMLLFSQGPRGLHTSQDTPHNP
jgi:hypothetical protein